MSQYIIYGLVDPRTQQLRYVGMSRRGFRRPREHTKPHFLKKNTYKNNWVKQLLSCGLEPTIVTIQEFDDPEILAQAEIHWIAYFKQMGCPLTNQCRGGEGFTGKQSPEARSKMSEAHRRRFQEHPELREISRQVGHQNRGKSRSLENREKIASTLRERGIKPPDWAALKGRMTPRPPDIGARISAGKRLPEELELQVVALRQQGQSIKQIATALNRSHGGVHLILKRRGIL